MRTVEKAVGYQQSHLVFRQFRKALKYLVFGDRVEGGGGLVRIRN